MADIPLDFGTLDKYGCFIGSGAVVVFSDKDDIKKVAINLLKFLMMKVVVSALLVELGQKKR